MEYIKIEFLGHTLVRISLGIALLISAFYNTYLDPEFLVSSLNFQFPLIPVIYILGMLLVLGLFTRLSSLLGLAIFGIFYYSYGAGLLGYIPYLCAYLFLLFLGAGPISMDKVFFGDTKNKDKYINFRVIFPRIIFGISLLFWGVYQPFVAIIGLCIGVGLQTRMISVLLFILFAIALFTFKELLWTQIMLLSLTLHFVINGGGIYTIDTVIGKKK